MQIENTCIKQQIKMFSSTCDLGKILTIHSSRTGMQQVLLYCEVSHSSKDVGKCRVTRGPPLQKGARWYKVILISYLTGLWWLFKASNSLCYFFFSFKDRDIKISNKEFNEKNGLNTTQSPVSPQDKTPQVRTGSERDWTFQMLQMQLPDYN